MFVFYSQHCIQSKENTNIVIIQDGNRTQIILPSAYTATPQPIYFSHSGKRIFFFLTTLVIIFYKFFTKGVDYCVSMYTICLFIKIIFCTDERKG